MKSNRTGALAMIAVFLLSPFAIADDSKPVSGLYDSLLFAVDPTTGAISGYIRADWVDVRDVLGAAADRVSRRIGGRTVTRDFPPMLTMVKTDTALLEQALVNILENAIAYSPADSTIELAAYEDRNNVVISIEDEGRGIPTAELERVFEKFRRMEESSDRGKGAGLGLAISKGFVEALGGRIAAASPIHEGKGTRILISLPKEFATPGMLL